MEKHSLEILFFCLLAGNFFPQISPPGLGKAHTADWFAFGIRQHLDTLVDKNWQSVSYVGVGRKSNPDNYNPFYKSEIFVLNQEFYHLFRKKWKYSLALSYRRQDEYSDNPPYEHGVPEYKQEFRLYSRISYIFGNSAFKLVPTFRQEYRRFYSPDFRNIDDVFQLRSRFRLKLMVNLNRTKRHRLIASSEQLFSISKKDDPDFWTTFNYQESRFCLYYSYAPRAWLFIFSIGYMNNLVGWKNSYDVHYLAFDIMVENPFSMRQINHVKAKENFE